MNSQTQFIELSSLALSEEEMIAGIKRWVECESPSIDVDSVNAMLDLATADLTAAGAVVERISDARTSVAHAILARFPHADAGKPGILVVGHIDTVHPIGTLNVLPCEIKERKLYGPATRDMKSGLVLAMIAMEKIAKIGVKTKLPITFLLNGDEEIGSPYSRELVENIAAKNKYVLIPEPIADNGCVAIGRHEVARFTATARGTPTHAGNTPEAGQSAIRLMAEKIIAIEKLRTEKTIFTVGIVNGGQWSNCVATECTAELMALFRDPAEKAERLAALHALGFSESTQSFSIVPLRSRPSWKPTAAGEALLAQANSIVEGLGIQLKGQIAGGGSDGNFTGALGVPTLDALGPVGRGHHTLDEHIYIDSLAPHALILANLLATLK